MPDGTIGCPRARSCFRARSCSALSVSRATQTCQGRDLRGRPAPRGWRDVGRRHLSHRGIPLEDSSWRKPTRTVAVSQVMALKLDICRGRWAPYPWRKCSLAFGKEVM